MTLLYYYYIIFVNHFCLNFSWQTMCIMHSTIRRKENLSLKFCLLSFFLSVLFNSFKPREGIIQSIKVMKMKYSMEILLSFFFLAYNFDLFMIWFVCRFIPQNMDLNKWQKRNAKGQWSLKMISVTMRKQKTVKTER